MKHKILLLVLGLFVCKYAFGQTLSITKENLTRILNEKSRSDPSINFWTASNKAKAFYSLDTISFYNDRNFHQLENGCEYINWKFFNKKEFTQNETFFCSEPPEETINLDKKALFNIKIKEKANQLYLSTYHFGSKIDTFKVIGIEQIQSNKLNGKTYKLTLVRVKKNTKD